MKRNRFAIPTLLTLLMLAVLPLFSAAQRGAIPKPGGAQRIDGNKEDKILALKMAFFTQKLDLSSEEAQRFWPIYNAFQNELKQLRKTRKNLLQDVSENYETMTDKEIEALLDDELNLSQKEIDLRKRFHPQFKSVLSIRKVALLYKAEEQFKRRLLEEIQKKEQ
jgi:hypothetical protein